MSEIRLVEEIIQAEREQDEITGFVAQWIARNPRPSVTMDELVAMTDVMPRLEGFFEKWYMDQGQAKRVYLFTFDGTLNGTRMIANKLGDDVCYVLAANERVARELCYAGIQSTIAHAFARFAEEELRAPGGPNDGIVTEAGGRKMREADPESRIGRLVTDAMKRLH